MSKESRVRLEMSVQRMLYTFMGDPVAKRLRIKPWEAEMMAGKLIDSLNGEMDSESIADCLKLVREE